MDAECMVVTTPSSTLLFNHWLFLPFLHRDIFTLRDCFAEFILRNEVLAQTICNNNKQAVPHYPQVDKRTLP